MRRPPIVGRAFLDVVALRALVADPLAEPGGRRSRMYGGIRITTSANASSRPWMSSTVIAQAAPPRSRAQRVDERVEADPPRRLDQDDVAVAQARAKRVECRRGVARRG